MDVNSSNKFPGLFAGQKLCEEAAPQKEIIGSLRGIWQKSDTD